MRNKQFYIDSVKMDLHRVVTASGNISKELPRQSIVEFIKHADKDLQKIELTEKEEALRQQLQKLLAQLPHVNDPFSRLRWAEDVMTIRCRL